MSDRKLKLLDIVYIWEPRYISITKHWYKLVREESKVERSQIKQGSE
jgi:uncharacterized ferritin-like protein (DUF455 family)